MALGNAIYLLLHRAGVGVDEEGDHLILLPCAICYLPTRTESDLHATKLLDAGCLQQAVRMANLCEVFGGKLWPPSGMPASTEEWDDQSSNAGAILAR